MTVTLADLAGAGTDAVLDDPAPGGGYRRIIPLALPTGGAKSAVVRAGETVLTARFSARYPDATAPGAVEPARLRRRSGDLRLSLPTAREIRRIRLTSDLGMDQVALYRFDGDVVAEQPTVAKHQTSDGARFTITDRQLIVRRLVDGDSAPRSLSPGDVDAVIVRHPATNPRIAIAVDGGAPQPLAPILDGDGQPIFPAEQVQGPAFAAALTTAIEGLVPDGLDGDAALPDPLGIEIILEADAPCLARLTGFSLTAELQAVAAPRTVLRFPGGQPRTRTVALAPPVGAILSAPVALTRSGPDTPATAAPVGGAIAAGADGVALAPGEAAAMRIEPAAAELATGVDAVIAVRGGPGEAALRLRADAGGRPGDVMTESASVALDHVAPTSIRFDLGPLPVAPAPLWAELVALRGTLALMLSDAEGGTLAVTRAGAVSAAPIDAGGRGAALALRVRPAPGAAAAPLLSVRLGNQFVPLSGEGPRFEAELGTDLAPGRLNVESIHEAVVTVDPIMVRYRL